tara:strand:- start:98 stop:805 length:708 start_codon:yes stop_codon:yes gene_type:complete
MALPRVNNPTYTLELPSTGKEIKYRPFLVKEQKVLMMAQDTKNESELANAMGQLVSACTFGEIDADSSPMFDIEYIFLKIRTKSVGSNVKLNVTCPDDGETQVQVELDLDDVVVNMLDDHTNETQITDNIKIIFRYPVLRDITNLKENSNDVDRIFHVLGKCIDEIHFGDDIYRRSDMTENDIGDFIDQLSSLQFEKLSEFFNGMPKLRHVIQVTNPKTKKKSEVVLEGLESFLE